MKINFIEEAIEFLDLYEKDGALDKASSILGKDLDAIAPLAYGQYSALVDALHKTLSLALGLGEDDNFFFEKRNGQEICDEAIAVLEMLGERKSDEEE